MPSTFAWIDHDDKEAQRVREALAAFEDHGMQDPLGFDPIRDAFSEMLFPGTSTVHTRARYFLLVPWVYQSLDDDKVSSAQGADQARERELALIESLLRGSDQHDGIIGRQSRHTTRQLPSAVYWGGLVRWGIRRFPGTRAEYVATLERRRQHQDHGDGETEPTASAWHPALPPRPPDLLDKAPIELQPDEADFLRTRVLDSTRGTYLAHLARDGSATGWTDTPWSHPLATSAPAAIQNQLLHAQLFSLVQLGASLRYNRELSERLEGDGYEPLADDFAARLDEWVEEMQAHARLLAGWDRDQFWAIVKEQNPRLAFRVRDFTDWWLDKAITDGADAATSATIGEHLRQREGAIKGSRAKLANRRAREQSPAAQGGIRFTYRWPQVNRIIGDILGRVT